MPDAKGSDDDRAAVYLARHDVDCPACGYNLRGLKAAKCPECGGAIDADWLEIEPPRNPYHTRMMVWTVRLLLNILITLRTFVAMLETGEEGWYEALTPPWMRPGRFVGFAELAFVFLPLLAWRRLETSSTGVSLLGERVTFNVLRAAPLVCGSLTLLHAVLLASVLW